MHRTRSTITEAERRALRTVRENPRGVRQPPDLKPAEAAICDRAFDRIIDVMEERVPDKKAKSVLTACAMIREEILGPQVQKLSVEGNLEHILNASLTPESRSTPELPSPESGTPIPSGTPLSSVGLLNSGDEDHIVPDLDS